MAGPALPTNLESTYADAVADAADPTKPLHRRHHDGAHVVVNRFDKDVAAPTIGQVPQADSNGLYIPRSLPFLIAAGNVSGKTVIDVTGYRDVVYTATLVGNTSFDIDGIAAGGRVSVQTTQDATGGWEATFGTLPYQPVRWQDGLVHYPPTQPGALDEVVLSSRDGATLDATGRALVAPRYGQEWHVYGNGRDALLDSRVLLDANTTSGTATLTSPSGAFTAQDIGRNIWVEKAGAAGATLATTITAVGAATSVTLAANAAATLTSRTFAVSIAANSAATTAGSFLSTDVGRYIAIPGAGSGGGTMLALIDAFTSATVVTLHVPASATVTSVTSTVCLVATVAEQVTTPSAASLITAVAARAKPGDTVWVHRGVYANTTFSTAYTDWVTVKAWPGDRVELQGIQLSAASYLFLSGFSLTRQSVTVSGTNTHHITLDRCDSENFIQTTNARDDDWFIVRTGGHYVTLQNSRVGTNPAGGSPLNQPRIGFYTQSSNADSPTGTGTTGWPIRPTVRDSDLGRVRQDCLFIQGAQNLLVERCVIHEPQHTGDHNDGIQMVACTGFVIRRNIFHNWENWPAQPSTYPDQGIIIGHVDPVQTNLKCKGPGLIENNLLHHCAGTGLAFAGVNLSGSTAADGVDVNNNTIYDSGTGASISYLLDAKSDPTGFQNYHVRARNNIVENLTILGSSNQHTLNSNNTFGPSSSGVTAGTSQLSSDPQFVDAFRYRLGAASPAIGSGTASAGAAGVAPPPADLDGLLHNATPDRGARRYF